MIKHIITILRLIRLKTSLIASLITVAIAGHHSHNYSNALLLGLAIMATSAFGYSINEYVDHAKDVLMPCEHLIPSGLITRKQVLVVSCCFLILSLLLTIFLSPFQILLNTILLFLLSVYSFVNNRNGIAANLLVALCCCLGIVITLPEFEWSLVSLSGVTIFLHILGREIILDIHDYPADLAIGKSSFPIVFSIPRSFRIAILLNICCAISAVIIGIYFMKLNYVFVSIAANLIFLTGLIHYRNANEERAYNKFIFYSRVAFLLSIPALLL